jgi:phospholipid/cholesterol/gamma-HCH transport system substrate-binding protein
MLSRTVRIQVLSFIVIALVGISYLAFRYVGISRWAGWSGYTVKVDLAQSGGIFTNAEVTYRGVPVGRVGDMRLTATGVQIDLDMTSDRHIPRAVKAVVADRSVIGEQYVDLRPDGTAGPYLTDGSTIAEPDTSVPPAVQDLLLSADALARSVPIASLQTVVGELYSATQGVGQDLQALIDSGQEFFSAATDYLPQTISLITTSKTVLASQNQEAGAIKTFSANLALIGAQLKDSNGDISTFLSKSAASVEQVGGLINDIQGSFHDLLSNLLTTSVVFLAHKDGLHEMLVDLPVAVSIGGSVVTPQGVNVGMVPTFFDPLPCNRGYQGTPLRRGLDTAGNPPLNTSASCTAPASSGVNVRGTQNAPGAGQ